MRKPFYIILIPAVLLVSIAASFGGSKQPIKTSDRVTALEKPTFKTGDVIYQSSKSGQGLAIQLATGSKFSHVGMIVERGSELMVFEAIQPVKLTKFNDFIKRGEGGHYVVSRLKNAEKVWTESAKQKLDVFINQQLGKDYDIHFDWSDDEMYCSELVWKAYKSIVGLEVGDLSALRTYDLSQPEVKRQMEARYGDNIPWDEPMIAPGSIFQSTLFTVILDTDC